jgi:hypothetical protein
VTASDSTDKWLANFHPFKDSTGVVYDIVLTKIDTLTNSNERLNLTVIHDASILVMHHN